MQAAGGPDGALHSQPPSTDAGAAWSECMDYSNGGPCFLCEGDWRAKGLSLLAAYADLPEPARRRCGCARPAAAVACQVGAGVAVLCGTHPELHPGWLTGDGQGVQGAQGAGHRPDWGRRQQVAAALREGAAMRAAFWLTLLHECRLGGLLRTPEQPCSTESRPVP